MDLIVVPGQDSVHRQRGATVARIEIRSFHCLLESTSGITARRRRKRRQRYSDEIAFVIALLPIDTGGSARWTDWVYGAEESPTEDSLRQIRVRTNTDVDSGEDHVWQYPISFDIDPPENTIFELLLQLYEVDGATATSTQGNRIRDRFKEHLDDNYRPGLALGSEPDALGNSGPTSYDAAFRYAGDGGNDDLLVADVWHVDPFRPLEIFNVPAVSGLDPDLQIRDQQADRRIVREVSRFPPRSAGTIIERREYTNSSERASYRFDVRYS